MSNDSQKSEGVSKKAMKAVIKAAITAKAKEEQKASAVAAVTVPDASNNEIKSIASEVVTATLAPVVAKIGSIYCSEQKPAAKPKSILKKTLNGAMKAPPMIGAMTATKATTHVSSKAKKAALTKIEAAAVPILATKREAARSADIFEEAQIPKKSEVVIDEETEDEEEEEE